MSDKNARYRSWTWNWQNPDWSNLKWDRSRIFAAEEQFLFGAGIAIGTVKHFGEDEHNQLLVEVMSVKL